MQGQRWRLHGEGFNYGLSHVRFRGAREPQCRVSLKAQATPVRNASPEALSPTASPPLVATHVGSAPDESGHMRSCAALERWPERTRSP